MRAGRVEISTMPDLFTARDGCAALRPAARDGCAATAEEEAIAAIVGKVKSPSSTFSASKLVGAVRNGRGRLRQHVRRMHDRWSTGDRVRAESRTEEPVMREARVSARPSARAAVAAVAVGGGAGAGDSEYSTLWSHGCRRSSHVVHRIVIVKARPSRIRGSGKLTGPTSHKRSRPAYIYYRQAHSTIAVCPAAAARSETICQSQGQPLASAHCSRVRWPYHAPRQVPRPRSEGARRAVGDGGTALSLLDPCPLVVFLAHEEHRRTASKGELGALDARVLLPQVAYEGTILAHKDVGREAALREELRQHAARQHGKRLGALERRVDERFGRLVRMHPHQR
jgi:hypothetical protein